jgi:hypothetical protein
VAVEVVLDQLGERQLGQRLGVAAQPRLDHVPVVVERCGLRREGALAAADAVLVVVA